VAHEPRWGACGAGWHRARTCIAFGVPFPEQRLHSGTPLILIQWGVRLLLLAPALRQQLFNLLALASCQGHARKLPDDQQAATIRST
jgi:hypothetical protein